MGPAPGEGALERCSPGRRDAYEIKVKFPTGKKARPPVGEMKTCTIKREANHWYIIFTCAMEQEIVYHPSEEAAGIDLGLLHFATLSDGSTVENPRHLRQAENKLK